MSRRPDLEEFHKRFEETVQKTLDERRELLDKHPMLDKDGYPTDHCLQIIKNWHWSDSKGWFEFIKEYWWAPDFGWQEANVPHEFRENKIVHQFQISTGGWSGNESIIRAMERNGMMWHFNWVQSRRGGHYIFEIYNVSYGLC
jgi:hypothetical protein